MTHACPAALMQEAAIATLVLTMMVAVGLRTEPTDFATVLRRPRGLFAALLLNLLAAPVLVLLLLYLVQVPADLAVGLLLCAASPGGATGPLFAAQARGQVAAAIAAMVALSMVSVGTAPLTLSLALDVAVEIDASALFVPMMGTLFFFQMAPLMVGMALRKWRPATAARLSAPMNTAANALLLAVIVGLLVAKGRALFDVGWVGVAVCVGLVLANLAMGALASTDVAERRAYVMVTGVRNISLALLLSAAYLPAPLVDATILTFGLFTMVLPFAAARLLARRDRSHRAVSLGP